MKKKYLFFDIDGTLVESRTNQILESTHDALRRCQEAGHFVAIASGRAHYLTREITAMLGIHHWVCDGGNGLVINDEYVYYEPMDQAAAFDIVKQCQSLDLNCVFNTEDSGIARAIHCSKDFEKKLAHERFVLIHIDDLSEVKMIRRIIVEFDPARNVMLVGLDQVDHMNYYGNLVVEPTSKYKGVLRMTKMMGGVEEDIIVFGDGINDLEMFTKAPIKIAMGNAVLEIKELATFITDEVDQNGIYNACIKLSLFHDDH